MDTLAEGVFAKKIIVGGRPAFWQLQLQRVFEKENWGVFALPPDYPDPQALLQVHNDAVILYVLPDERGPAAGEELVQRLLELLRISREQSVQGFYLISTLAAGSSAGQQPDNPDAAMAEHIVTKWAAMTGIPSGIIRLPDVYGPGDKLGESLLDRWLLAILQDKPTAALPEDNPGMRSFLYADDAVYGIYQAISRRYQGQTLDLIGEDRLSAAAFEVMVEKMTGSLPLKLAAQPAVYTLPAGSGALAQAELGWKPKYNMQRGARLSWVAAQAIVRHQVQQQPAQVSYWSLWRDRLQGSVPYLENLAGALLMLGISYLQGGSPVNPLISFDLNFVYIGTMGLLYGKQQALLAMLLAAVLLTGSLMQQGVNLVGMLYQPEILLHLVSYLFAAVLTGYFADSRAYEREAASWQKRHADERYAFLKGIYEETLSVKDRLYRQILNADDSIGRLYSIIRQLDSVELENVFTQAAVVTAQVLSVDNIVVYVVSDQYYLRQKVRLGSLAEQQPRSLRVEEHPYLQSVLQEKTIYVNRELVRSAPDLAAPIIYEGQVIAVVEILGMHFDQWNLSQQNLLSITTRLISASMGRAYQYEAEIQSRRYYGSTRIMQEAEFGKIMEDLRARQRIQRGLSIAVLEVDMTGLDYPALDAKLSAVIRSEDFIGNWQGHIYVLLPDADDDVTAMVQQRMQRAGVHTTVSEEVL